MTRICIVGGGSSYMPGIAYAFAREPRPPDATIVLQDVDAEALDLQLRLTRSILRSRGAGDVRVEADADRLRALEGADLVLATFRPGGFPARHLDERIAIDHGIVGQETAGPGGFAMALRSVPVVLDLADDLRRVAATGVVLLDYTNPVQIVTEAVARFAPDVACIGLCDQTDGERWFLARVLGVDRSAIELDTCGTNHMTFTRAVRVDGRDVTNRLWAALDRVPLEELSTDAERRTVLLFRRLRHVPSEYLQYYAFHDEVLAEQRAKGRTRAQEVIELLPAVLESYRREADRTDPRPSMARASEGHGDLAVSVMTAIASPRRGRFILNVRNDGAVPDLPAYAVVEVPSLVEGRSVEPIPQPGLPDEIVGLVERVAEHARLTAEAAATGDRALAVRALAAHPLVPSVETAGALVDAYLRAHHEHLPRFTRP